MWFEVQNLKKSYGGVNALRGISFSHKNDEILGIIGPNGAGKSTLFDAIGGLIHPDAGRIYFKGKDLTRMPPHEVALQGVARCFQTVRLARRLSIAENLIFGLSNPLDSGFLSAFSGSKPEHVLGSERGEKCLDNLKRFGMWEDPNRLAGSLSFGQQKLLSVICCTARDASLILLDEPVAGVSSAFAEAIVEVLKQQHALGRSIIVIEHDMDIVATLCDRVIFLDQGALVCDGTLDEIRRNPRVIDAYIAAQI